MIGSAFGPESSCVHEHVAEWAALADSCLKNAAGKVEEGSNTASKPSDAVQRVTRASSELLRDYAACLKDVSQFCPVQATL
jgi:hypothetical protein